MDCVVTCEIIQKLRVLHAFSKFEPLKLFLSVQCALRFPIVNTIKLESQNHIKQFNKHKNGSTEEKRRTERAYWGLDRIFGDAAVTADHLETRDYITRLRQGISGWYSQGADYEDYGEESAIGNYTHNCYLHYTIQF